MFTNIKSLCDFRSEYLSSIPSKLDTEREVIVITDHDVSQFSLNSHGQLIFALSLVALLFWSIFATGGYFFTKDQLARRDIKLAETSYFADQLHDNLSIFRRDLTRLSSNEQKELDEYKSFVVGQYKNMDVSADDREIRETLLERVTFLENKLTDTEKHKTALISAIQETTSGEIKEIDSVIKKTGIKVGHILKNPPLKFVKVKYGGSKKLNGKGGPYQPATNNKLLGEHDKKLLEKISYLRGLKDAYASIPLGKPMKKYRVTSRFGGRADPFTKKKATHEGLDMAWKRGTPVRATADGVVLFARKKGSYGYVVQLDHGYGFMTYYGHLATNLKVKKGDKVKKGEIVAYQGNTGRSTGDHLHYEVRFNKKPVNPKKFLEAGYGVL